MRRDVFQAIADPTRRKIIQVLSEKPLTINRLAENFTISRPAISKQVKILNQCGLLSIQQQGRERLCQLELTSFGVVNEWIGQYKKFWNSNVETLEQFLETEAKLDREEENQRLKAEEEKRLKEEEKKKAKPANPYQYSLF